MIQGREAVARGWGPLRRGVERVRMMLRGVEVFKLGRKRGV